MAALERTCGVLGIRLVLSRLYRFQSRGKVERANGFIRERLLLEAEAHGISSRTGVNDRLLACVEQLCNTRSGLWAMHPTT